MQMEYRTSKKLTQETIEYAAEMNPMERNGFIDLMSDQYHIAIHKKYPKREVKKFSDLLTKLVKKFGN
jgi:molybdate-binding protein|tara:strand:- start:2992 stop:3195 length:204 start_codon:yes stop_codon:yes gene_type:complete